MSDGSLTAAELTETLSAPAAIMRLMSATVRMPPPTQYGMRTSSAAREASSTVVSLSSEVAVMSRNTTSSAPSRSYAAASSTGSPASRSPTKLTPFTTLPSFTSRQGMTRLVSMRFSLGHEITLARPASRRTSSIDAMPPEATTGKPATWATCRYAWSSMPDCMPSRATSV